MKLTSNEALYHVQLKDLASTEKQIEAALPAMEEAAKNESLKQAFATHREETAEQHRKIEELLKGVGKSARGRKCKGIEGILAEGAEAAESTGDEDARDLSLIAAARRVEHFEMAAYIGAIGTARALGREEDVEVLRSILEEEKQTDRKLAGLFGELTQTTSDEDAGGGAELVGSQHSNGSSSMSYQYDDRDYDRRGRSGGYDDDDRGYGGRSQGGRRSSQMQDRDEYGQFTGYRGSSRGGGGGGGYDEDRGGGYDGRSRGGRHSAEMQDRDEYGRFTGYDDDRGGGRGNYGNSGGGGGSGRRFGGSEGRSRGGRHSAEMQERDEYGRFMGYDDDDDRGSGRSGGGGGGGRRHSSGGGGGGRGGYDDDDRGYITDSAGRRYTRESWEAAQEGRSRGGQHSHGGGGQYQGRGGRD